MRIIVLVATILITLVACNKNDLPTANGDRLHKVITTWRDSIYYTVFKYDQKDRLIEIIDSNNNNRLYNSITSFSYDGQGKLAEYQIRNGLGHQSDVTIEYDVNERVIKKINNHSGKTTNVYTYDTKGRLIADTVFNSQNSVASYSLYTYDNNDNVIEWHEFIPKPTIFGAETHYTHYFVYDDKPNSYSSIGKYAYFFRHGGPELLSKNNLLQIKVNLDQIDYSYEYYNSGLPKKICVAKADPRAVQTCTEFFFN